MPARVVILGAGFAGLFTALRAHRLLGDRAEITLVDRNDYFLYTPMLFELVSESLQTRHVARPLSRLVPSGVRCARAEVGGIDLAARRVQTGGGPLSYDLLVIALGSVPNFYGMESIERHALRFKWLSDVQRLQEHIKSRVAGAGGDRERAADAARVVIAGAGCTGVELIAELDDWMAGPLMRWAKHTAAVPNLVLVEALDHLLCPTDMRLTKATLRDLARRKIDVRLAYRVVDAGPDWVKTRAPSGDEQRIDAGTLVWTAGVKAAPALASLPVTFGPGARLPVTPTLQLSGHPEVLVLGDAAACPDGAGGLLPATAQVAVQQAAAAAKTLRALVDGAQPEPFRYRRMGEVVSLGRMKAVAEAFGLRFQGFPGWLVTRSVHLSRLPDWGDRVAVAWESVKDVLKR
jgi:NADH dehydrogenase